MSLTLDEGDEILDRYRLERFLGEGGMAKAWLCRDERTGGHVVAKYPNYDSKNQPWVVEESIEREIEILESIRDVGGHPNVMGLIDRTTVQGRPVAIVDYVRGEELDAAVRHRNGFRNTETVRKIGVGLCEAMSFLHRYEIIYRDLKPDNVMLKAGSTPVLIDFNTAKGLVLEESDDGTTDTYFRDPFYKPPELRNDPDLVGIRQGPWSDVYSIGKVLLFMFLAHTPRGDAIDPRDFRGTSSVPDYLAEIIQRATQPEKDDRYRNARVLEFVLEHRTSTPPGAASVTHLQEDTTYEIYPGDTVGRKGADGPPPAIRLDDPGEHISAVQVEFDTDEDDNWILWDRSLNGTWVKRGEKRLRILSTAGRKRREDAGESEQALANPPERVILKNGDRIELVHPEYDVWLEFESER